MGVFFDLHTVVHAIEEEEDDGDVVVCEEQ
jgi:hypothetical protein